MHLPALVAITPGDGRDLRPWVDALASAGLPGLLIREVDIGLAPLQTLVRYATTRIRWVWVHGKCGHVPHQATGEHMPVKPTSRPFGRSCHDPAELQHAFRAGATWAFYSPIFPPTSKPNDRRPPIGLLGLEEVAPLGAVYALGGVTPERHAQVVHTGAVGSAVLGDLFGRRSPEEAAARLRDYDLRT
jgi:hypothetical protein